MCTTTLYYLWIQFVSPTKLSKEQTVRIKNKKSKHQNNKLKVITCFHHTRVAGHV